jgi:hypothetical protein
MDDGIKTGGWNYVFYFILNIKLAVVVDRMTAVLAL